MSYNPYYSQTSANFQVNSYNNKFFCWLQDGKIYTDSAEGSRPVGVTYDTYKELETTATEYKNRLVELGEIDVPLTQEQVNEKIIAELNEERAIRQKLSKILDQFLVNQPAPIASVESELKNESERHNVGSNGGDSAVSSEPNTGV